MKREAPKEMLTKAKAPSNRANACQHAAYRIWERFEMHCICVELSENTASPLDEQLPVDVLLDELSNNKNAPNIVFEPLQLSDHIWTKSLTAYVYAGIEQAFTSAARMPGDNLPGHVKKLRGLKAWAIKQLSNPDQAIPKDFATTTALLFAKGILDERRPQRVALLQRIRDKDPTLEADLSQLIAWIETDLADKRLESSGRPSEYQRIIFAAEIANLWNRLTGEKITRGPKTFFAQFLLACWESGFLNEQERVSFKRIIRHNIAEDPHPKPCGKCECCKSSKSCDRLRYFGTLGTA